MTAERSAQPWGRAMYSVLDGELVIGSLREQFADSCSALLWACARIEPRALGRLVVGAVLGICLASCSVSVFAEHPDQETKYDALWSADWHAIVRDEQPLLPSASSPGVCNVGGSKQGCYDADVALIADFRKLEADLSGTVVPSEFARGNAILHQAILYQIQGLSDRNEAIASQNPNATLSQSNRELELGMRTLAKALSEYRGVHLPADPFK